MHPPGAPGCQPSGCDSLSVGVVRLRGEYFEARAFFCFVCSRDKTRQRAERARAMMAPAAQQLVFLSRCPTLKASAPLSLVALRCAVQGQLAWAVAVPLSVQGLGFILFGRVSVR